MFSSSLLRSSRSLAIIRIPPQQRAALATGPAAGGHISDELLQKLGSLSTQALVDGLWVMGWPNAQINGTRALASTMKCVGRAVTLKFVPARPDIAQDKPPGGESPEYEAFELCGPNEVRNCNLLFSPPFSVYNAIEKFQKLFKSTYMMENSLNIFFKFM
jgi:hypothetical protein